MIFNCLLTEQNTEADKYLSLSLPPPPLDTLFVEILENPWELISRPSRLTSWLVDCGVLVVLVVSLCPLSCLAGGGE